METLLNCWKVPKYYVQHCGSAAAAAAAAFDLNGMSTLLGSSISTFLANHKPTFSNGAKKLPRNPPDWTILEISFFL